MKPLLRSSALLAAASLLVTSCASAPPNVPKQPADDPHAIFREIYDAIFTGDRAVWERWLAADFVLVDRDGTTKDKKSLIAELEPISPKITLHFDFEEMSERQIDGGVMLLFLVRETETILGQTLHVDYRNSLLFAPRDGGLRLVAWQYVEIPKDAPPTPVDPTRYDAYVGTYAAEDARFIVRRIGTRLYGERPGRASVELVPEADGVFYVPGTEFRKIFVKNGDGRVIEMLDRRKGSDLRWRRME